MANFPKEASDLFRLMYERHVEPLQESLEEKKKLVDSHRPPTEEDIQHFLATADHREHPLTSSYLEEIEQLQSDLDDAISKLHHYVKAQLYTPADQDTREACKKSFTATKNNLVKHLQSMKYTAEMEEENEVVEWVTSVLDNMPKLTGGNKRATEIKEARKWLQENRPDAGIKARGQIPTEWLRYYYEHKND